MNARRRFDPLEGDVEGRAPPLTEGVRTLGRLRFIELDDVTSFRLKVQHLLVQSPRHRHAQVRLGGVVLVREPVHRRHRTGHGHLHAPIGVSLQKTQVFQRVCVLPTHVTRHDGRGSVHGPLLHVGIVRSLRVYPRQ